MIHHRLWLMLAVSLGIGSAAAPARAQAPVEKAVFGYYLGIPVYLRAQVPPFLGGTGPAAPSRKVPDLIVYVTAPTSSNDNVHAPPRMLKTPQGERYLPPHEDTLTRFVTAAAPADALGYFVVAGPKASPESVQVAIDPRVPDLKLYLPGGPLAKAIKVGEQWLPLNNHKVIEYGLRSGLLTLRYFDYGGLMWAEWEDSAMPVPDANIDEAYPVVLPAQSD